MIARILEQTIQEKLGQGKAIIIMGPRQVGKTTLLKQMFTDSNDILWLNGDEQDTRSLFENISATRLKYIFGQKKIVIIDEAQRIENIGLRLKLITEQISDIQLIATGSSSFDLANKVNEPLTGRKWEYKMYPLSFKEMRQGTGVGDAYGSQTDETCDAETGSRTGSGTDQEVPGGRILCYERKGRTCL